MNIVYVIIIIFSLTAYADYKPSKELLKITEFEEDLPFFNYNKQNNSLKIKDFSDIDSLMERRLTLIRKNIISNDLIIPDSIIAYNYLQIGYEICQFNPSIGLRIADTVSKLGANAKSTKWRVSSYILKGLAYDYLSSDEESDFWYRKAIEISLNEVGDSNFNNYNNLAWAFLNYATLLLSGKDYKNAYNYLIKAQNTFKDERAFDNNGKTLTLLKIAEVSLMTKNYKVADSLLISVFGMCLVQGNERGIVNTLGIASRLLNQSELREEAKSLLYKVLRMSKEHKLKDVEIKTLLELSYYYFTSRYYDKSLYYSNLARIESSLINKKRELAESYRIKSLSLYQLGNYKEYYYYNQLYDSLINSINTKEVARQLGSLEAKLETEKLLSQVNYEKEIQKSNLKLSQTITIVSLIFGMILLVGIVLILIQNQRIKLFNKKIGLANKKLTESEEELFNTNNSREKLLSIISHDLKNPINALAKTTNFLKNKYTVLEDDDKIEFIVQMDNTAQYLNTMNENLLSWSYALVGNYELSKSEVNLKEIIENSFSLLDSQLIEKKIEIEVDLESEVVYSDELMLETIIRNIISNAVKFVIFHGLISITYRNNMISITNQTDKMMDDINKGLILNKEKPVVNKGTMGEVGTGYGLMVVVEFINKLGWNLKIENSPTQTSFIIDMNS